MRTEKSANSSHHDTIIIGAGISGLACAAKLLEHSSYQTSKTLLVLEARERIGGRIESIYVNGNRLDTGANWIHGLGTPGEPNPLVGILPNKRVKELNCSVSFSPSPVNVGMAEYTTTELDSEDWVTVESDHIPHSNSDLVIPSAISGELFGVLWTLIGSLHEKATKSAPETAYQTSMLAAIKRDQSFKDAFEEIPAPYHRTLRGLPQFLETIEAGPLLTNYTEQPIDKKGMGLLEFSINDYEGDQVFLGDGYKSIVEEVGKEVIRKGQIKFRTEVKGISWDAQHIVLSTSDGRYTANRVVCTLPLGVLQNHVQAASTSLHPAQFFESRLPSDKVEAIKSLGFGTLDKIFMVYDRPWWTEEPYKAILKKGLVSRTTIENDNQNTEPESMWGFTDELSGLGIGPDGTVSPGVRALSIINLHALTGFPVLSSFVSCANATHIESLTDHAASMIVYRSLTKWFGREVPLPDAVHVTRWSRDAYARGSYTHMVTNLSKTSHREAFQAPIINKYGAELRFAGEHTSRNHFATVHGALLSGWREANAIIASEDLMVK